MRGHAFWIDVRSIILKRRTFTQFRCLINVAYNSIEIFPWEINNTLLSNDRKSSFDCVVEQFVHPPAQTYSREDAQTHHIVIS